MTRYCGKEDENYLNLWQRQRREQEEETRALESEAVQLRWEKFRFVEKFKFVDDDDGDDDDDNDGDDDAEESLHLGIVGKSPRQWAVWHKADNHHRALLSLTDR